LRTRELRDLLGHRSLKRLLLARERRHAVAHRRQQRAQTTNHVVHKLFALTLSALAISTLAISTLAIRGLPLISHTMTINQPRTAAPQLKMVSVRSKATCTRRASESDRGNLPVCVPRGPNCGLLSRGNHLVKPDRSYSKNPTGGSGGLLRIRVDLSNGATCTFTSGRGALSAGSGGVLRGWQPGRCTLGKVLPLGVCAYSFD
jgi:hypothetical protein